MKSNVSAGKRIEYNFGTFNPGAMFKINKDLSSISPRQPEKGILARQVKLMHTSCMKLNENIDEFKQLQSRDFKQLKIELLAIRKEILKMKTKKSS